jgi:hypothetical protein
LFIEYEAYVPETARQWRERGGVSIVGLIVRGGSKHWPYLQVSRKKSLA